MKVLIDTNVVLDVLLKRPPFYKDSFKIFRLVDHELICGCLAASSIIDIFYLLRKDRHNSGEVYQIMDELTALFRSFRFLKLPFLALWRSVGKILKMLFNMYLPEKTALLT